MDPSCARGPIPVEIFGPRRCDWQELAIDWLAAAGSAGGNRARSTTKGRPDHVPPIRRRPCRPLRGVRDGSGVRNDIEVGLEQIKTIYTLAKWSTENSTPELSCYDMTDNTTCQTIRSANVEGGTVLFITLADKTTVGCFKRDGAKYRMCSNNAGLKPELLQGHWVSVPVDDKRCSSFGDQFDEDYLACEAALPARS